MYSKLSTNIRPFTVMELLQRGVEFESAGLRVVHFEVGEPDFAVAAPIAAAAHEAITAGHTKYTAAAGMLTLRERIAEYYAEQQVGVSAEQIFITSGASGGLTLLAALLLNPGDELLMPDPSYPCNEVFARLVGASVSAIPVDASTRFQPTLQQVKDAWTERSQGILLASPANPTGTMIARETLAKITNFVRAQAGALILDEIYQGVTRDAVSYTTALAVTRDIFVLNSFSKFFGMTGWRLGWVVVPLDAAEHLTKLAQNLFISPNAPAQHAALAAFSDAAMAIHIARNEAFANRAARLAAGLESLGFKIPIMPDGAFYLYVDISHLGMTSNEFCWQLMQEYQVAVTPGDDFGQHNANRYVRFAYTTDADSIDLGIQRIASALRAWGLQG